MDALKELDRVAYLRFASVYKDFQRQMTSANLLIKILT